MGRQAWSILSTDWKDAALGRRSVAVVTVRILDMEGLDDLLQLITLEGQKMYPLIAWPVQSKEKVTKEQTLFCGLQAGTFQTDDQAAQAIYGTDAKNKRYIALKARGKQKIMNHLFFLDFEKAGSHPANAPEHKCLKLLHFAKVLRKKGSLELAERSASKLVELATKAGFNPLVVYGLEELQYIYAQQHQPSRYRKITEKLHHYRQLLQYEHAANDLYLDIKLRLNHSVKQRQALVPEVAAAVERLRQLWQLTQSFNVFEQYYILRLWYLELINNFEEIIQLADEADGLCREGLIYEQCFDHHFNRYMKVHAYLRTKQYETGLQHAEAYLETFNASDRNWFVFMENYVLLALHVKNYELTQHLLANVLLNPHQQKLPSLAQARWTLYRAYLYFLLPPEKADAKFDFHALVSQLPHYRKDKAGFNVAILILQFLYFLQKNDLDSLLYRVEALSVYMAKYLQSPFSERVRTLFKLFRAVTSNYHLSRGQMRRRCDYLSEKLASLPTVGDAYAEVEIIPYEHVWELCLQWLPQPQKKAAARQQ